MRVTRSARERGVAVSYPRNPALPRPPTLVAIVSLQLPGTWLTPWLAQHFAYFSTEEWEQWLSQGLVHRNGKPAAAGDPIVAGDRIESFVVGADAAQLPALLYADADCVVVNKAPGMVCATTSALPGRTFARSLAATLGCAELHFVHRLDRGTSGALLLARHAASMAALQEQFRARRVGKQYLATVVGAVPAQAFSCSLPIGKHHDSRVRSRMLAAPTAHAARPAHTDFTLLATEAGTSLLRAVPHTGRTHQIRAHLEACGLRLVNDPLYGAPDEHYLNHLHQGWPALHSEALDFITPGGEPLTCSAPLPPGFPLAHRH